MKNRIIEHYDKLYEVIKDIGKDNFMDSNGDVDMKYPQQYMKENDCDRTLQTEYSFLFCREIEDAEVIEDEWMKSNTPG